MRELRLALSSRCTGMKQAMFPKGDGGITPWELCYLIWANICRLRAFARAGARRVQVGIGLH